MKDVVSINTKERKRKEKKKNKTQMNKAIFHDDEDKEKNERSLVSTRCNSKQR